MDPGSPPPTQPPRTDSTSARLAAARHLTTSQRIAAVPAVSVVILTYNSAEYIGPCLGSLMRSQFKACEIVVIDNASRDHSAETARAAADRMGLAVNILKLAENRGCAGGNNAGWRATTGDFVVFLNPDTEVAPGFLGGLLTPMLENSRVGVTGAKIYYPGTTRLQHAGGIVHPNGMSNHYGAGEEDRGNHGERRECDYVTGAGFAVRRSVLEELKGFDEDFFPAYFEETDLCRRAREKGWRVLYAPEAVLYHHESVSLVVNSKRFRRLYQRMRILYCLKNYSLRDWLAFARFEFWWMRREPAARGHRLEQFKAYVEGFGWYVWTRFFPVRKRWAS